VNGNDRPNLQESRENNRGFWALSDACPAVRGPGNLRVPRFLIVRQGVGYDLTALCPTPPLSLNPAPLPVLLVSGRRCVPMRAAATLQSISSDRRAEWSALDDPAGTRAPDAPCEKQWSDLREPLHVCLLGHRAGTRGGPSRSPRAPGATHARRFSLSRLFRAIRARCPQDTDQQQRITSLLRAVPSSRPELHTRPDRWCP
jgi:hypothetical protein